MGKEVEKLITENNELLATKNALNIVKDDLIVKVDELSGEIEIMREELLASNMHRERLRLKLSDLEDEVKKTKEQAKQQTNPEQEDEAEVPMAQRKRFTRVEMARVLMERNQVNKAVKCQSISRSTHSPDSLLPVQGAVHGTPGGGALDRNDPGHALRRDAGQEVQTQDLEFFR